MRTAQLVALEVAAVSDELARVGDVRQNHRLRGALAALEWVLGQAATAPVSGRLVERPDGPEIRSEAAWATEILTGVRPASDVVTQAYAGGAEEALLWVSGSDCVPVPTEEIVASERSSDELVPLVRVDAVLEAMTLERSAAPDHYDDEDLAVLDGILGALSWLRGLRPACPLTEVHGPVTAKAVTEAGLQLDALIEALPPHDLRGAYAGGAAETLAWAVGRRSNPPSVY